VFRTRLVLATLGSLVLLAQAKDARGEEPLQTADGVKQCRAFDEKNEKELAAWSKQQPSTPYVYPAEETVVGAPWGRLLRGTVAAGGVLLATALPHVGTQLRGESPAAYISWPLSVPFGPIYSCSRKSNTFVVHGHRPSRIVVEPALVSSNRGVGFSVRPGYRFIWHPTTWVVGVGGGLGSTIEIAGNSEPFRPSFGMEALAHFGQCCSPSFFMLALRYDHYFIGRDINIVGLNLGYTYF
jgi:hypothetical protein